MRKAKVSRSKLCQEQEFKNKNMDQKIIPVILSGGSGTRLWPLSRALNPKQFLSFFGKNTLFQDTALRVSDKNIFADPLVICNNEHRFIVAENLATFGMRASSIILEPIGRNTAPAIAVAAFEVLKNFGAENDLMLVMPSDHIIVDEAGFIDVVKKAAKIAKQNYLITFGIVPSRAETGYGYIKQGDPIKNSDGFLVEKFVEKPDKETAASFLKQGGYQWNSGIFMLSASVYLAELKKLQPEIYQACEASYLKAIKDLDFIRLDEESFAKSPNISADYAVMEKLATIGKIAVAPLDVGWDDVGNWDAIAQNSAQDENKNSFLGDVVSLNSKNCYINSQSGLVAALGLEDIVVVNLKDVVLVANKNNAQDVKKIYELLKEQKRPECNSHTKVLRPWGSFETLDEASGFKVKRIIVKSGASLSLQMHHHRAEHWIVVKGNAIVTCEDKEFVLKQGQSTFIPLGKKHRLENKSPELLEIIEVQTGGYLGEDDIVRFSDIYGRDK